MIRTMLILASVVLAGRARAATLCVNPGGTGGCYSSIQAAVDAAVSNDLINVAAGSYSGGFQVGGAKKLTIAGAGASATTITTPNTYSALVMIVERAKLTLSGVKIMNSSGAGIQIPVSEKGKLTLSDAVVTGSGYTGIDANVGGKVTVENTTLSGNGFSSAVFGGGLSCDGCKAVLRNSTLSGNDAVEGAGISVRLGRLQILTSTISGNSGAVAAGGVYVLDGSVKIRNSTIVGNSTPYSDGTGGIYKTNGARVTLSASIIANNTAPSAHPDCSSADSPEVRSRDYNLVENATGCFGSNGPGDHDVLGMDPVLGPLADNGGPTQTHAVLGGSPALNAVLSGRGCNNPDQRGVPRTAPCDIGAYEAP